MVLTPVQRTSATVFHGWDLFGHGDTELVGPNPSQMNAACILRKTQVEIVNKDGAVMAGPGNVVDYVQKFSVDLYSADYHQTVTLMRQPVGGSDLSAPVTWHADSGQEISYRLRYFIDKPAGVDCTP